MKRIFIAILLAVLAGGLAFIAMTLNSNYQKSIEPKPIEYPPLVLHRMEVPPCFNEGDFVINMFNPPPCCQGLTKVVLLPPDEYNGCPSEEFNVGSEICIKCGDGICGVRETICSCPQDCFGMSWTPISNGTDPSYEKYLKNLTESIKPILSRYYPNKFANYSSSGKDLIVWLRENEPALLRDMIAALKNPKGIIAYVDLREYVWVSKEYAVNIIQTSIGEELSNISVNDYSDSWYACAVHGVNRLLTCCSIPKFYGPGQQLSCKQV